MMAAARLYFMIVRHPANDRGRIRAVLRSFLFQMKKRLGRSSVDIPFHGLRLRIYGDSHSGSAVIYFNALPDYREMIFMRDYLRPGDNFIDVGANIGVYSLYAVSIIGETGSVVSFEPGEKAFGRLLENVSLNGLPNVEVVKAVVSDEPGSIDFVVDSEDCTSHIAIGEAPNSVSVSAVVLDDVLEHRTFAMGKMDIEGAEPRALAGAGRMLADSNPPVWQVEVAGYSKRYGTSTTELLSWMKERGYDSAVFSPTDRELIWTRRPWELGAYNILAISRAKRDFVLDRVRAT